MPGRSIADLRAAVFGDADDELAALTRIADADRSIQAAVLGAIFGFVKSGVSYWYGPPGSASTANNLGNGSLRLVPIVVPKRITLDRIAVDVTVAGDVGSTIRLGLYANKSGDFYPGDLVASFGTVTADSVAVKELTIDQALDPGIYWVGGVIQGVTVTQPTVRTATSTPFALGNSVRDLGVLAGYAQSGVTGALPSTFSTSVSAVGSAIRSIFRVA